MNKLRSSRMSTSCSSFSSISEEEAFPSSVFAFDDLRDVDNFYELLPDAFQGSNGQGEEEAAKFQSLSSLKAAMSFPFLLDSFQRRSVLRVERGENVFVAAHTSAGKTVVAEYAIAKALKSGSGRRAIYTAPIKALSNQKYRDFVCKFPSVGVITGDVRVNPEAQTLIMTTEILRGMLMRKDELIASVGWVIFDECHFINDKERGVVWEECLIQLPYSIPIVLLSATVPNYKQFSSWVAATRKSRIFCSSTKLRPTPLHFYLAHEEEEVFLMDSVNGRFNASAYKDLFEKIKAKKEKLKLCNKQKNQKTQDTKQKVLSNFELSKKEVRDLSSFLKKLRKEEKLPAAVFIFSRGRLEEVAESLALDLLDKSEKDQVEVEISAAFSGLPPHDRGLPMLKKCRSLALKGVGMHHGGLLPLAKELTEILFSKGLIMVLLATETFAMGVNMPARSVIFMAISKNDGQKKRDLLPTEFTQMAGRAGRRGLDKAGFVFLFSGRDQPPPQAAVVKMMLQRSNPLTSKFRVTYQMILQAPFQGGVEGLMRLSFLEGARRLRLPLAKKDLEKLQDLRREIEEELGREGCGEDSCRDTLERFERDDEDIRGVLTPLLISALQKNVANVERGSLVLLGDKQFSITTLKVSKLSEFSAQKKFFFPLVRVGLILEVDPLTGSFLLYLPGERGELSEEMVQFEKGLKRMRLGSDIVLWTNQPAEGYRKVCFFFRIEDIVCLLDPPKDPNFLGGCQEHRILPKFKGGLASDNQLKFEEWKLSELFGDPEKLQSLMGLRRAVQNVNPLETGLKMFPSWSEKDQNFIQFQNLFLEMFSSQFYELPLQKREKLGELHRISRLLGAETQSLELEIQGCESELFLQSQRGAKTKVLEELGYLERGGEGEGREEGEEAEWRLTEKGEVARELLSSSDDLVILECIYAGIFSEGGVLHSSCFSEEGEEEHLSSFPAYLAALISGFMAGGDGIPDLEEEFFEYLPSPVWWAASAMKEQMNWIQDTQDKYARAGVEFEEAKKHLSFGLLPFAVKWAQGSNFLDLVKDEDLLYPSKTQRALQEGQIVRALVRTDELIRKIQISMEKVGDDFLAENLKLASKCVRRDIVFAGSLYLNSGEEERD